MTAQLKLSLIIGFGLVLVVAIIFADHLSPAAGARMGIHSEDGEGGLLTALGVSPGLALAGAGSGSAPPAEQVAGISLPSAHGSSDSRTARGDGSAGGPNANSQGSEVGSLLRWNLPIYSDTDRTAAVQLDRGGDNSSKTDAADPNDDRSAAAPAPNGGNGTSSAFKVETGEEPPALVMGASVPENVINGLPAGGSNPLGGNGTNGRGAELPARIGEALIVRVEWYTVEKGDSLYGIAEKFYGDGSLADELGAFNADRVPENLMVRAGVRIRIPSRNDLLESLGRPSAERIADSRGAAEQPAPQPKRAGSDADNTGNKTAANKTPAREEASKSSTQYVEYVVKKGDSFSKIAKSMLGSERRWYELYKLNKAVVADPDNLVVGTRLRIPRG